MPWPFTTTKPKPNKKKRATIRPEQKAENVQLRSTTSGWPVFGDSTPLTLGAEGSLQSFSGYVRNVKHLARFLIETLEYTGMPRRFMFVQPFQGRCTNG
jgi:hypothetical protein